jgi:hypothetical protein
VTTTLCIDEQDRLSTPVHLQALHCLEQGSLVVHAVVGGSPADLARGLLESIGFAANTPGWPGRSARAMQLASAWIYAFEIKRIVIYGAWRLRQPSLDWMQELQQETAADVTLVTAGGFPNADTLRRAAHAEEPLRSLLESSEVLDTDLEKTSTGGQWSHRRLQTTVPPLPAAPVATFLAEAGAALEHSDFYRVALTFQDICHGIHEALRSQATHEEFCVLLDDLLATARSINDIIIQVRAAQAGALMAGLNVQLDLQEICRIAYPRRDTNPRYHDAQTLTKLGVDPRIAAAAALAIATRCGCKAFAGLRVSDFDAATGTITINGKPMELPLHLVLPVRAQHYHQTEKGRHYLLARTTRAPAAHSVRKLLASSAPRAAAATTRKQALRAYLAAIVCESIDDISDPDDSLPVAMSGLHPDSVDDWEDQVGKAAHDLAARFGLPIMPSGYRFDPGSAEGHQADALDTLTGVRSSPSPARTETDDAVDDDVRVLHAVLLRHGGKVSRRDLYRALRWTADRTQVALHQLQQHMPPLGEIITEEPPDYILARAIDHKEVDNALRILRAREQARDGLTTNAARLLYRLLLSYPERPVALPDGHPDAEAQAELCQAEITWFAHGKLALQNTVAMTFGNYSRHRSYQPRNDIG